MAACGLSKWSIAPLQKQASKLPVAKGKVSDQARIQRGARPPPRGDRPLRGHEGDDSTRSFTAGRGWHDPVQGLPIGKD